MRAANDTTLRVIADGLIHRAECKPRGYRSAQLLRDAAAALLDADMAEQREAEALLPANDPADHPAEGKRA